MALGDFEMELLMTKLDYLQDKLQEVEQTMNTNMKEVKQHLEEKLIKHEKNINERIEMMETKFETNMRELKESLQKSVETSEHNTWTKLEDLKNQFISKMDSMQLQQTKTYQETTQIELKKLEDHLIAPLRSCRQVPGESGTYLFRLWKKAKPFDVFCEQNKFEGGWIVIQHRFDGSIDFYRNWTEYRNGFGNVDGEFWLGLEYVHQITKNRPHELLVEVKDFDGNYGYAKYDGFEIGSETESYALKKLGTYSGTAGDSMQDNKDEKFSTFDRDNDIWAASCAELYHGAWWYYYSNSANLNGRYLNSWNDDSAMKWYELKEDFRGLSYSRMMIRDIIT
ncbi:hypothetical protein ZHAS_00008566 [Anopheles sinensis]|uniref:Fibrinogen C-terminal domain-containing protein n=1 Tax=Anopheles sinensis TaxID=74873 RepID=A0A084VT14_ANOSI|nr:hypothetical protein ZHAS_00008566 [Anopheles sinensis]